MMIRVVSRTINERFQNIWNLTVTIVNTYGPKVHEDEKYEIQIFVEWENERKKMVRETLHEPIDRMKSMAGKG